MRSSLTKRVDQAERVIRWKETSTARLVSNSHPSVSNMSVLSREGHRLRHSPGTDLGCGGLYKAFGDDQITATEFLVLVVVADNPGVSQADLAQAPDVERPRILPRLNKLEKRRLAKQTAFAGDGRIRLIQPMKRGHQLVRVLKKQVDETS